MSGDEQALTDAIEERVLTIAEANRVLLRLCAYRLMCEGHSPAELAALLRAETARYREKAAVSIAMHERASGVEISGAIQ